MNSSIHEFGDMPDQGSRRVSGGGAAAVGRSDATGQRGEAKADGPLIGVIYNPRSHRNKGQDLAIGDRERVILATPEKRGQITEVLADFAARGVDYLIISGGD
ncbi:MAG: diacylglycerol kinase, partial [Pseudomonadota bacterium]|nr:diacylglycerol kinase [Pseudomonadota bacterium]